MAAEQETKLEGTLVITGMLECRDKDGVLLKVIDLRSEVPMDTIKEEKHGDQRSE